MYSVLQAHATRCLHAWAGCLADRFGTGAAPSHSSARSSFSPRSASVARRRAGIGEAYRTPGGEAVCNTPTQLPSGPCTAGVARAICSLRSWLGAHQSRFMPIVTELSNLLEGPLWENWENLLQRFVESCPGVRLWRFPTVPQAVLAQRMIHSINNVHAFFPATAPVASCPPKASHRRRPWRARELQQTSEPNELDDGGCGGAIR